MSLLLANHNMPLHLIAKPRTTVLFLAAATSKLAIHCVLLAMVVKPASSLCQCNPVEVGCYQFYLISPQGLDDVAHVHITGLWLAHSIS